MKLLSTRHKDNLIIKSLSKWQIKIFFIAAGFIIGVSAVVFTKILVDELIKREQTSIKFYTDIYKSYTDPNANIEQLTFLIDKITPMITFPIILTDEKDIPLYPFVYNTMNIKLDTSLNTKQLREVLKGMVKTMGNTYPPIIIEDTEGKVLTKVYYTHSALVDKLRMFPYVEILIVAIFIFIGYIAFSNIRRSEESKVWVGMAKEAAHQLGTPLSSLLAWIEIIKYSKDEPQKIEETINEMSSDITRLNVIATRFSKIGSQPEMKLERLDEVIENVCVYFEKRLPHLGRKVTIYRKLEKSIVTEINSELFAWVIENLLKNAAEAIENKQGKVHIKLVKTSKKKAILTIADNGKGMSAKQRRQVFQAGFTTKKRGWGLGLSLCRRIIEEYHKGKIYIKDSSPGKGATFQIELMLGDN